MKDELVDAIKSALLPELQRLHQDMVDLKADNKVIAGRLDQVERAIQELREDVREVRSYVFVSKVGGHSGYQVKEGPG